MAATAAVALLLSVGLFIVLPAVVAKAGGHRVGGGVAFAAVEGALRLSFFLGYLLLMGRVPDIRRLFAYHGAEHKAIAAYENGVEVTPESAQRFTTEHVRCGTNFLLTVMVLSIVAFGFIGRPSWLVL